MNSSLIIKEKESDKRLDIILAEQFCDISRSQWQKKIKAGEVLVNNKEVNASYKAKEKDNIEILNFKLSIINKVGKNKIQKDIKANLKNIKVVAECDDYAVINKPAGLVVHPDGVNQGITLVNWLVKKYPEVKEVGDDPYRPGIVHRLDKDVSGLLVIARNAAMFNCLKEQFKKRKVNKEYWALVHNKMRQEFGEIKIAIKRSKSKGMFIACSEEVEDMKEALTQYEVIKKFINFTLLKVEILTGRTHQIRVHLSSIGHPIVGDKLYVTHDIKSKKRMVDLGRLWLQSVKLGFKDLEGKKVEYEIKTDQALMDFLKDLK